LKHASHLIPEHQYHRQQMWHVIWSGPMFEGPMLEYFMIPSS